jgi:D-3-phosphoglycerate dehydrogenase
MDYKSIKEKLAEGKKEPGNLVLTYNIDSRSAKNLKELLTASDIVSLHVPETPQTKNLINKNNLKYFKKGALLLNYARGEVVDLKALAEAIKDGLIGGAGIDVFPVEPEKNGDTFTTPLQGLPNVILKAQQNIGEDVSIKLFQYLERGITNGSHSVPSIALPPVDGAHRILHMHNNVPGVLSAINTALSKNNINIVGQYLKTNEEIGYVVLDVDTKLSKRALELLKEVKETIKVRMLY